MKHWAAHAFQLPFLAMIACATAMPELVASESPSDLDSHLIADFRMEGGFREMAGHGATADIRNATHTPLGLLLDQGYEHQGAGGYRATLSVPELQPEGFGFLLDFAPIAWGVKDTKSPLWGILGFAVLALLAAILWWHRRKRIAAPVGAQLKLG